MGPCFRPVRSHPHMLALPTAAARGDGGARQMTVTHEYFPVFNAVLARIGALGPTAGRVVRFYTLGKSLLEDIAYLNQ
jgi:hypothetical protein